jgi:hypothetical protein
MICNPQLYPLASTATLFCNRMEEAAQVLLTSPRATTSCIPGATAHLPVRMSLLCPGLSLGGSHSIKREL